MSNDQIVGQIGICDRKTVVLTGHHHCLISQVLDRMVGSVMTVTHFFGASATGQRQNLVSETNTEEWQA